MPGLTGLELAQRIQRHELPMQGGHRHHVRAPGLSAPRAGGRRSGYLLKDAPAEKLAEALRSVHRGGRSIDPAAGARRLVRSGSAQRSRTPGVAPVGRGAVGRRRSPTQLGCPPAPCATICPRPSASSASTTASRPIAWRGSAAGFNGDIPRFPGNGDAAGEGRATCVQAGDALASTGLVVWRVAPDCRAPPWREDVLV